MTRKRVLILLGSVCLALVLVVPMVAGCAAPTPTPTPTPTERHFILATPSVGTTANMAAITMTNVIRKYSNSDVEVVPATGGYYGCMDLAVKGQADMVMSAAPAFYLKPWGIPAYFMLPSHITYMMAIVPADSPVKEVADLKGKKISTTKAGLGAVQGSLWLKAEGIDPEKDVELHPLSPTAQFDALKDGVVDAVLASMGCPMSSIIDLTTHRSVRFLPLSDKARAYFDKNAPGTMTWLLHKASVYKGVDADLMTLAHINAIYTTDEMEEEDVYEICVTWLKHWEEGGEALSIIRDAYAIPGFLGAASPDYCPYHPGAVRAYKDAGVEILK